MVIHFVVLCIFILIGTVVTTGILGRLWRFVMPRPVHRMPQKGLTQRFALRAPGPDEFAEQQAIRARLDAPFAAVFLGLSIVILATPGFDNAWVPTFLLWLIGAAVRWRETGPAAAFARLGIVILLALEALLVVGIHGGVAIPQAAAYAVFALIGVGLLYYAQELPPISFGPGTPDGDLPPRRRAAGRATNGSVVGHSLYDTLPATQRQNYAQATPIVQGHRNPQRVRADESRVLSSPYYPQTSMQAGGD